MSELTIRMAMPSVGERGHVPVDLGLGADVDAARRLVEDQHLRLHREPLAEHDLLLVAARQVHHRLVDRGGVLVRRRLHLGLGDLAARSRGRASRSARSCRRSGSEVFCGDRHRQHEAVALAILGREVDAALDGIARAAGARTACPSSASCRRARASTPKIVSMSSVRPAPTRPAKPRISPRRAVNDDAAPARPARRTSFTSSTGSRRGALARGGKVLAAELAPDHHRARSRRASPRALESRRRSARRAAR